MGITLAHCERTCGLVVFAWQKAINDSRGDALRTQHHRHGGREVFTMALLHVEEKIRQWISAAGFHLKGISVVVAQIRFNGLRGVVPVLGAALLNDIASK